jgi:hypothetical protein
VGSSAWQCKHACFNEKFFLTMLTNNSLSAAHFANVNSHLMPNKWAGDRSDLSNLIKEKGLHFHTLSHAQYATMVLVHSIAAEQRANKIADHVSSPGGVGSGAGAAASASHLVGVGSAHLARENYPLLHAPSMRGAHVDVDPDYHPYHIHCSTGAPIAAQAQAMRRTWNPHSLLPLNPMKTPDPMIAHIARGVGVGMAGAEGHGLGGRMTAMPFSSLATSLYPALTPSQRLAQNAAKTMLAVSEGRGWTGPEGKHGAAGVGVAAGHGMGRPVGGTWPAYLGDMEQDEYGLKIQQWFGAGGVGHPSVRQLAQYPLHGRARAPSAAAAPDRSFSGSLEREGQVDGDSERDRPGQEVPLAVELRQMLREGTHVLDETSREVTRESRAAAPASACLLVIAYIYIYMYIHSLSV